MKVVLERVTERRINLEKVKSQIQRIAGRSIKGSRGRGWSYTIKSILRPEEKNGKWCHTVQLSFEPTTQRASVQEKLPEILEKLASTGATTAMQGRPWVIVEPAGYSNVAAKAVDDHAEHLIRKKNADEPKELGEINLVPSDEFDHIYDRQHQIARIFNSLELAKLTNFQKRTHCLLNGPPGCGKTEILEGFKRMLGESGEAYLSFDGSNMTRAGVVEELLSASHVPPILIIEEIEKCEEQHLRWLMSIMDKRGEVRRTNYRVGTQAKNVRMVVLATANNVELLERYMGGAIASRFDAKIYCPRPSEDVMRQILLREIKGIDPSNVDGNPEWVEGTIEFLYDKWGITDPRSLISFCTGGRDKIITGVAQQEWEATLDPAEQKKLKLDKIRREKEQSELQRM